MKKIILQSLCCITLVLCFPKLYATHIVGGDLSYECLGTGQYKVTLKVYRDCFFGQAAFDNPARVSIYNGPDGNIPYDNLLIALDGITNIPFVSDDPCLNPPNNVCVEQGLYEAIVSLPVSASGYHLSYQRCCRNNTITNLYDPGSTGATYTIFLSGDAQNACNSSPVFNAFPPLVICNGEDVNFDHSASDANGDSTVYSFCAPFIGGSIVNPFPIGASPPPYTEVGFINPPYSSQSPMAGNPIITIDSNTGLITGQPEALGQYVVGICVEEYRNGTLLSVTKRDFQFNVVDCIQPTVIGVATPPTCTGDGNGFVDLTVTNSTSLFVYVWDSGTNTGTGVGNEINGLGAGTYDITITNFDDCIATTTVEIIDPLPLEVTAIGSNTECSGSTGSIELTINNGTPTYNYNWMNISEGGSGAGNVAGGIIPNLESGTYLITVTDAQGCTDETLAEVVQSASLDSEVSADSINCNIGQIEFSAAALGGTAPFSYIWNNGSTSSMQIAPFGDVSLYSVTITDVNGCIATNEVIAGDFAQDSDGDGKIDECDICPYLNNFLIGTACDDLDSLTVNDVYTSECICEGKPSCVTLELRVLLEGAYTDSTGVMRTELNNVRGLLPGQTPSGINPPTPSGQPYNKPPWNYIGIEGYGWTDADYINEVVDWILVSFRTGTNKSTESAMAAGLVHEDGYISFPGDCILPYKEGADSAYVVIEHRNHIGIMTQEPVYLLDYTLIHNFSLSDSYRDATSYGQKQMPSGEWVMYVGDGDQTVDFPSYDINGLDKAIWQDFNGTFDIYALPDYNMDGDVNGQDKILWTENNGISSRVPK